MTTHPEGGIGIGLFGGAGTVAAYGVGALVAHEDLEALKRPPAGRKGQRMTTTKHPEMTETEALRADLELTRQHLAATVQQLTHQLNVPRRIKDSATSAGHRAAQAAGTAGARAKDSARNLPTRAKQMPATARQHPKATAAVGGAVALGVGAAAWIVGRSR